jgi:hypothetical protein
LSATFAAFDAEGQFRQLTPPRALLASDAERHGPGPNYDLLPIGKIGFAAPAVLAWQPEQRDIT